MTYNYVLSVDRLLMLFRFLPITMLNHTNEETKERHKQNKAKRTNKQKNQETEAIPQLWEHFGKMAPFKGTKAPPAQPPKSWEYTCEAPTFILTDAQTKCTHEQQPNS